MIRANYALWFRMRTGTVGASRAVKIDAPAVA